MAVVTEVDVIAGVKDFLMRSERLQPGLRRTRAGASYVSGAEPTEANAQWIVDKGMEWFRGWVYTAFSADLDNRDNPKLFQMMCEISQRRAAMAALISSTLYRVCSPGIRLQGVYFAATGRSLNAGGRCPGGPRRPSADLAQELDQHHPLTRCQRRQRFFSHGHSGAQISFDQALALRGQRQDEAAAVVRVGRRLDEITGDTSPPAPPTRKPRKKK